MCVCVYISTPHINTRCWPMHYRQRSRLKNFHVLKEVFLYWILSTRELMTFKVWWWWVSPATGSPSRLVTVDNDSTRLTLHLINTKIILSHFGIDFFFLLSIRANTNNTAGGITHCLKYCRSACIDNYWNYVQWKYALWFSIRFPLFGIKHKWVIVFPYSRCWLSACRLSWLPIYFLAADDL